MSKGLKLVDLYNPHTGRLDMLKRFIDKAELTHGIEDAEIVFRNNRLIAVCRNGSEYIDEGCFQHLCLWLRCSVCGKHDTRGVEFFTDDLCVACQGLE